MDKRPLGGRNPAMPKSDLQHRLARHADIPALAALMEAAIAELQKAFLTRAQIAASRALMGLDTQLIDDGTYFVVEEDGALAGCGGWSRRATLYGGDRSPGRDAALLDPARDAARVRAMYTHPDLRPPGRRAADPVALRGRPPAPRGSAASSSSPRSPASRSTSPAATGRSSASSTTAAAPPCRWCG